MDEYTVRGYELRVKCWGPGIEHDKPVLELHLEKHNVTVLIADDYQHLEEALQKMLTKVRERAGEPQ